MNLSLKINDTLVYPAGNGIKYVMNSPAFSENAIPGDFSYPLTFVNTPQNRKVFEFVDRDDAFLEETEKECEILIDEIPFVRGKFQITKTTKQAISGNIVNNANDFSQQIKTNSLKNLTLDILTFDNESDKYDWMYQSVNESYPYYPGVMFPVMNNGNNTKNVTDVDGNEYTFTIGNYINGMQQTDPSTLEFGVPNQILFLYIPYIIEKIFSSYHVTLQKNIFADDPELARLVLLNFIKSNSTRNSLDPASNILDLKHHIADVNIADFLNEFRKLIAHGYFFNPQRNIVESEFLKDLLIPGNYVDWTNKVTWQKEKDFDHENDGMFFYQDFNDDICKDKQSDSDIVTHFTPNYTVNKPDDLPPGASQGEIGYVTADNAWYHFNTLPNNKGTLMWRFLSWNFSGKKILNGKTEKPTKLTTAGNYWYDRNTGVLDLSKSSQSDIWMIPQVGLKVIDSWSAWKLSKNDPRIVFYRGIQKAMDDDGYYSIDYPMGTSGNTDPQGNKIGDLKLQWDGDDGIYHAYWEEWINTIRQSKSFQFELKLNITDILNIDLRKQVKINANFYLIKKITFDLPLKSTVKAELIQV